MEARIQPPSTEPTDQHLIADTGRKGESAVKFLERITGRKSKTDIASDIVQRLMRIVVSLMASNAFSASAPEITAYLRDKETPDLLNSVDGCDDLLGRLRGPMPIMNPAVILNVREAIASELLLRGHKVAQSPLSITDFDLTPRRSIFPTRSQHLAASARGAGR